MAVIYSPIAQSHATVDPTSKALRAGLYSPRDSRPKVQYTFAASSSAKQTIHNTVTAAFLTIYGSGARRVKVQRILLSITKATGAAYVEVIADRKRQQGVASVNSGGTLTGLKPICLSLAEKNATATSVNIYSATPTTRTLQNPIASIMKYVPITASIAREPAVYDFDWRRASENHVPVLDDFGEGLELCWGTSPATAVSGTVFVWWTEEDLN